MVNTNIPIFVRIKENSFRAKLASIKLKSNSGLAMVWGNTILLNNVSKQEFLANKHWVCHELRHILQVQQFGKWRFLWRYFILSIKYGYHNNPLEVDARLHDSDFEILDKVQWV